MLWLAADVYKLLPFLLAPLMTNPVAMAANSVNASAGPVQQASDMAYALLGLLPQLGALRLALPADTLAWRLQLLKQGADWVDARSSQVWSVCLRVAGSVWARGQGDEGVHLNSSLGLGWY